MKELLEMLCHTFVFVRLEQILENFGAFLATGFDKFVRWRYNMIGAQGTLRAGEETYVSWVFSEIIPNAKEKKHALS